MDSLCLNALLGHRLMDIYVVINLFLMYIYESHINHNNKPECALFLIISSLPSSSLSFDSCVAASSIISRKPPENNDTIVFLTKQSHIYLKSSECSSNLVLQKVIESANKSVADGANGMSSKAFHLTYLKLIYLLNCTHLKYVSNLYL